MQVALELLRSPASQMKFKSALLKINHLFLSCFRDQQLPVVIGVLSLLPLTIHLFDLYGVVVHQVVLHGRLCSFPTRFLEQEIQKI